MDTAVGLTNMEFGGITPVGLPEDWPILIDEAVMNVERVVIGSGIKFEFSDSSKCIAVARLIRAVVICH